LQALLERGYLYELTPRGGYYPTLRLYQTAKVIADHDPVPLRADAILRALRDKIDESILMAKVNGLDATYLLSIEPSHPLRFLASVGQNVRSLHATSGGKALLGSLSEQALSAYLKTATLASLTPKTITSKAALREELFGDLYRHHRGTHLTPRNQAHQGCRTFDGRVQTIGSSAADRRLGESAFFGCLSVPVRRRAA
jgi:DNA-binding IclR family transcriptional regulator